MGIIEHFRRKFDKAYSEADKEIITDNNLEISKREYEILNNESTIFFPESGAWTSSCFRKPTEISRVYLPCHLRDSAWLSRLMQGELSHKGIHIPRYTIKKYMETAEEFDVFRHNYEQEIVKWQIGWIMNGGENWLMPNGYDEIDLLFSSDVDAMVRGGVVKTLRAIGIDKEAIEEGLEKNADLWRPASMERSFSHEFEPIIYHKGAPAPASEEHRKNWLADREYQYYQEHKDSVDKYGTLSEAMKMSEKEHDELVSVLEKQNSERLQFVQEWKNNSGNHLSSGFKGDHRGF